MSKHIIGNWKMNGSAQMVREAFGALGERLPGPFRRSGSRVALCPPFPYLAMAVRAAGDGPVGVGAQNVHPKDKGAFTGEVSPAMLADLGIGLCIVGHSERRHLFGESDAFIRDKVAALLDAGMEAILCVGETLEQREAGRQDAVVRDQVTAALEGRSAADVQRLSIAYEPVWAIGTGRTATPEQAQSMHRLLRGLLAERLDGATAGALPLLYGGSVNPDNAGSLLGQPDIDGVLVGGASLKADSLLGIIDHALP